MKTLILGEALNRTLSSGTLEIIKKAQIHDNFKPVLSNIDFLISQ